MTPSPLPPSASSSSSSPSSPHASSIRITHLLPLLLSLLTLLPPTHSTVATAAPPLRCATHPWSHSPRGSKDSPPARATALLPPDKVNDGYCDCPLDGGIDEPATGACSGAADGMWAGLPPAEEGRGIAHFACPQQPLLILPLSRVRDGICDCCDGADEADSGGVVSTCIDVCEEVLAEERAMRAKVRKDYEVGSVTRDESLRAYDLWKRGVEDKLTRLTDGDMGEVDARRSRVGEELYQVKVRWGEEWSKGVKAVLNSRELRAVVAEEDAGGEPLLNVQQLSAILLSLCQLSGEISSQYLSNGRCLPLERAAVDLGILWEYNPDETASPSFSSSSLPKLTFLADGPGGYIMVADRVLLRLEGKDYVTSGSGGRHEKEKKGKHGNGNRRQETMMDHDVDDYYGDDYEDYHDYYSYDDEDEEEDESPTDKGEDPTKNVQPEQSNPNAENESNLSPEETMVKSLLDAIPLAQDRKLFKRKAKSLLQYAPPEDAENNHEHDEETVKDDGKPENDGSEASTSSSSAPSSDDGIKHNIDPMAIQMVKSTLSKRLSSISHGETSAESAARFIASLAEHHNHTPSATATITPIAGTSHIRQLQDLILLVIYHGKISAADVAELIYAISPDLTAGTVHDFEGRSCLSPVAATRMCPPRTIPLERGDQRTFFPPSFLVEAANRRCREREDDGAMTSAGTCASAEDTPSVANGFPTTVPDGYFHYYEPKQRKDASDVDVDIDPFHTLFAPLDDLHAVPDDIRDLQTQKQKIESEKKSLEKAIQTLQSEREQSTRYGYEGELYSLRDTCHSVESGKYEYEVCIFGQATQRDIGQSHGGTHLGNWESYSIDEETRQRMLKWGRGTKCWNGPVRSAEVEVTCGAETRLLTADEPETCRYVFRMESPIGCDEKYKSRNLI